MPGSVSNLVVRELLNGGLLPINACLLVAIGHHLWCARQTHGKGWSGMPGVSTACALWWIFLADASRALFAWYSLRVANRYGVPSLVEVSAFVTWGYIIGGFIAILAELRCLYLFTPSYVGHWGWMTAVLLTATFLTGSHLT